MEKHKIKCEMIQDILPLYVDGLTSDVTNQEIEEHVAECEVCKAMLNHMREPEIVEEKVNEKEKIDILKVIKKQNRKHVFISVLIICTLLVVGFFVKIFFIGSDARAESVICTVRKIDDKFHIEASLADSGLGFVKTKVLEGPNFLRIDLKTALVSPFSQEEYETEYTIKNLEENKILRVYIGDRIVWEEGHEIPINIFELYQTRHEYVGDASANGATAMALGMGDLLGNFTHELDGKTWTIVLEEVVFNEYEVALEEKMKAYACVLMALVDNLEVVRFEYTTEAGHKTSAFDTSDAMIASGGDIKTSVRSAKDLLMLMRKLDLEEPSLEAYEKIYTPIQVAVNSELQIDQMMIHYFLDGKTYATAGLEMPEEVTEDYAKNLEFIFPKIDWILNKEEHHTLELELDIFMKDGIVYHVPKTGSMPFELDETYMYDLIGNPEEGFRLELKE